MKAKHFKKLRAKAQYYYVEESYDLFGYFSGWNYAIKVLARHPEEAVRRAVKRGYGRNHKSPDYRRCEEKWAEFRVKEVGRSNHWRNIYYFN